MSAGAGSGAAHVVMVLENCGYPLDARVRMEAEELIAAGCCVEVLAPREAGQPWRDTVRGVRVRRLPLLDGGGGLAGIAVEYAAAVALFGAMLAVRIMRGPPATLHVHNPPDLFFPLMLLARRRGWRTVFDYHDDAAGMLRAKSRRAARLAGVLEWMRDRSASAADLTVTTNDTQRRTVACAAARVAVVRNGPPVWFADHRARPPAGRVRLVFLGEIGEQDRVERAVEILDELIRRGTDAELLIIGDGPSRERVEARAAQLGIGARVQVTGWVAFERVPELLATANVGLDTAERTPVNDGSTMVKVMEYLAVGLPVVATDLAETRVTGGDAVALVCEDSVAAYVDAVEALLRSPESWHESARRARDRGSELMWPSQARNLLAEYPLVAVEGGLSSAGAGRPPAAEGS